MYVFKLPIPREFPLGLRPNALPSAQPCTSPPDEPHDPGRRAETRWPVGLLGFIEGLLYFSRYPHWFFLPSFARCISSYYPVFF